MECVAEQEFLYKDLTYAIIGTTDGTDYEPQMAQITQIEGWSAWLSKSSSTKT